MQAVDHNSFKLKCTSDLHPMLLFFKTNNLNIFTSSSTIKKKNSPLVIIYAFPVKTFTP